MNNYYEAQIYLIECTHPSYDFLKYVGLDTKRSEDYLSSSTVVKWFINLLGRSYFKKTILEEISGTMSEICAIEQKYIKKHNAVKDPCYMNMSGGRKPSSVEECLIDLDWNIEPSCIETRTFINEWINEISSGIKHFSQSKRAFVMRLLSVMCYGYLKYDQEFYEYSEYRNYLNIVPEEVQAILSVLSELGVVESGLTKIMVSEAFVERVEEFALDYSGFKVTVNN